MSFAEITLTAVRTFEKPGTLGLLAMLQALPFQRSMRGVGFGSRKVVTVPTAMQNVADGHDTDVRDETVVSEGTG